MAKVDLYPDFKAFLELLNSEKVEYLVLGGYAVVHYGYRRVTDDLDVWVAVNARNAKRVSRVLQTFAGFPATQVKPALFTKPNTIFMFGREPVRIDVLTGPSGVDFDECFAKRNVVEWDGVTVPLISFEDLKVNKLASGREKDLADLRNLPPSSPPRSPGRRSAKRKR